MGPSHWPTYRATCIAQSRYMLSCPRQQRPGVWRSKPRELLVASERERKHWVRLGGFPQRVDQLQASAFH
eukprot:628592-Lingulodinium_polyedra.AAC.1